MCTGKCTSLLAVYTGWYKDLSQCKGLESMLWRGQYNAYLLLVSIQFSANKTFTVIKFSTVSTDYPKWHRESHLERLITLPRVTSKLDLTRPLNVGIWSIYHQILAATNRHHLTGMFLTAGPSCSPPYYLQFSTRNPSNSQVVLVFFRRLKIPKTLNL